MSELIPVPLHLQLARAFAEYEREGKIFDLPKAKFYRGLPGLDTSVRFHGHRAATPLGPAAGPHDQLVQNIVLSWLGGSRIIELKTVQILDELKIPRPCIDMTNVGYNVEWSQELKLEQSLREYVGAMMMIEVLKASHLLGEEFAAPGFADTIFDMSVGYNLEGISSPRVRKWMEQMKDASEIIHELRHELVGPFAKFRDMVFPTCVSDTLTLSTFHGCPAHEIEGIVRFLLTEMDLHVVIKLNPTLLGKQHVEHLLHDVLGYSDILVTQDAFDHDLQFDQALEMIPRLEEVARSRGKRLGVKFSNTLVVKNHRTLFTDETMYMSGAPLHVLTLSLVDKFRSALGRSIPTSFSAGLDANNMANCVAMNLVPVTTCTDLLRPGGYSRLSRYMDRLGEKMRGTNVAAIPDFVVRYAGQGAAAADRVLDGLKREFRSAAEGADASVIAPALAWADNMLAFRLREWVEKNPEPLATACADIEAKFHHAVSAHLPEVLAVKLEAAVASLGERMVEAAGLLNTPILVKQATEDPRYAFAQNKSVPRKIGSKLWLYDCINCDKCVPDCPNDANFVYDTEATEVSYMNYEIDEKGRQSAVPGGVLKIAKTHQLANYADACNDCGNCDVFCPEDGGPQVEKPRFFGSFASYRKYAGRNGFFLEFDAGSRTIHGVIAGHHYVLTIGHERGWFDDGTVELELDRDAQVLAVKPKPSRERGKHLVDMRAYHELKLLLESISNPSRVHYANVAEFQGKTRDQKEGAVPGPRLHHHAGMD